MGAPKIRRDDLVKVISGKDKGKTGKVLHVEPKKSRVFVEGLNIQKRHMRPRSLRDTQRAEQVGGVIEKEGPIHISNVMLLDPKSGDPTRIRIVREDGQRKRIAKRSGEELDD
jgi:large subunit ribosomal protein L24